MVEYTQDRENVVAGALSRRQCNDADVSYDVSCSNLAQFEALVFATSSSSNSNANDHLSKGTLCIISFPTPSWLSKLKNSYDSDPKLRAIL